MNSNIKIRKLIRDSGLYQYQVCDVLGITETTLIRWLRKPLPHEKENLILDAISSLLNKEVV